MTASKSLQAIMSPALCFCEDHIPGSFLLLIASRWAR
jgi:hypothetical protein